GQRRSESVQLGTGRQGAGTAGQERRGIHHRRARDPLERRALHSRGRRIRAPEWAQNIRPQGVPLGQFGDARGSPCGRSELRQSELRTAGSPQGAGLTLVLSASKVSITKPTEPNKGNENERHS